MNDTAICTVVPALLVLYKNLDLNLNDLESVMSSSGSSLKYYHKLPDVFAYLYIVTSRSLELSTCMILISHIQSVNYTQFLNITCLLFMSAAYCCCFCSSSSNSYGSFHKYVCITVIA